MGELGFQSAVFVDGNDWTSMLNRANLSKPIGTEQTTTFRSPGFAHTHEATLSSETIQAAGFLPMAHAEADAILAAELADRDGQDVLVGIGGLEVGNLALFATSLKTTTNVEVVSDAVIKVAADFQVTAASPGVCKGVTLSTPHGSTALSANETQTLVFTNVPASQLLAFRKAGTETLSASWTAADNNTTRDTRLEELYGAGTLTVTGSLTTSTDADTGETLYSGTLTLVYAGDAAATDVPQVEVVTGEVHRYVVTAGDGDADYAYGGSAGLALGFTATQLRDAIRATGGVKPAVNVGGTSTAAAAGGEIAATVESHTLSAGDGTAVLVDGYAGEQFNDGNRLVIDLGSVQPFSSIILDRNGTSGGAGNGQYTVHSSNNADMSASTLIGTYSANVTDGGNVHQPLGAPVSARYVSVTYGYTVYSGFGNLGKFGVAGEAAPGEADLKIYYPPSVGDVATPTGAGTGHVITKLEDGGTTADGIVGATTIAGLSSGAIYNPVTGTGNGDAVAQGAADTDAGGYAILQCVSAQGSGKTLSVKIQHAPDDEGDPGTWVDLVAFDAVTAKGSQRKTIDVGDTIHPHLRAVVTAVTGTFVYAVAFARRS